LSLSEGDSRAECSLRGNEFTRQNKALSAKMNRFILMDWAAKPTSF